MATTPRGRAEAAHDPFLPLAMAATATDRIKLATGVAVALSRSPMHLVYVGNDLQPLSGGRFVLGLGSQVKAHIERRFSAPFSRPAARMRELVMALGAIWTSWNDGTPFDFRGDFYAHTLMPPLFRPEPNPYGPPPVFVAGVGERYYREAKLTEIVGGTNEIQRNIVLRHLRANLM
jgi:probable F420-dependent oxidoreductase